MKPLAVFALLFALLRATATAAEPGYKFEWVRTNSGPNQGDSGEAIAVDADGFIFVAGHHSGLDLDRDGRVDVVSRGSTDGLAIKNKPDGVGIWLRAPGGPDYDTGRGVAVDRAGGAYVVGSFKQNLRVGDRVIQSTGPSDGYLIRYDTGGKELWARAVGGAGEDALMGVDTDSEGNAYVVGMIRGAVDVDRDGAVDVDAKSLTGVLLASFAPDGKLRWARTSGGPADDFGWTIEVGQDGALFVGGTYRAGHLDLDNDGQPDTPAASEQLDAYIARFRQDGALEWVKPIAGPDPDMVRSLAQASNGDLIVVGGLYGATDFDGDGRPDAKAAPGERKSFLARYTAAGKRLWARAYATELAYHVAANSGRIAITGLYKGPLDLDEDGKQDGAADPDGKSEGFAAILDDAGTLKHVFTIVGPGDDQARAAVFSPNGEKLFVTGFVRLTADFDGDGVVEGGVQCDAFGDMFIAGYDVKN